MANLPNQLAIPSLGQGAAASPQPVAFPYATGVPREGPLSAVVFATIPAGASGGSFQYNISQFGMSMVQSVLVCNEANSVPISIKAGQTGVPFGIQPLGSQMIPVYMTGTLLNIDITLNSPAPSALGLFFQIFNTAQPPASWVSNLAVNGNVNIATITGTVNVDVQNAVDIVGNVQVTGGTITITGPITFTNQEFGITAMATGGASGTLLIGLTNVVQSVKGSLATFKGFGSDNTGAAATNYIQLFDAATPGAVTLGTTVPKLSYALASANQGQGAPENLPPEGIAFLNGIQIAATTTVKGAVAPVVPPNVNVYFA